MEGTNTWKSKWIIIPDNIVSHKFVVCNYCSHSIGDVPFDKFPKQCPKCKRDMENGKV